ncbi:tRNA guanosine(34) transglycosylase Tgt [soil metagenome]
MTGAGGSTITATDGAARVGRVHTARGSFATPCFMPVGTRGTVRMVSAADLERLGAEVVLANTYHLMLRPGADVVAGLGGLHDFTGWPGHLLTDSGGYQVFSLEPRVDDDGVLFRSTYDGTTHRLTPESAVAIQAQLGADIQMVLDVCPPLPAEPAVLRQAVDRTAFWAKRARAAFLARRIGEAGAAEAAQGSGAAERDGAATVSVPRWIGEAGATEVAQQQYGIVQGGVDEALRAESARRTVAIGFDGYGIGGLSVGEPRDEMLPALAAAVAELPADRPRYLMGVGDPVGLVEAIALGVDMFDCVLPTRLARHGTVLSSAGRFNVKSTRFATDDEPLDPACRCEVCARHSRGYLRHLVAVREPIAARLLTLHNLAWTFDLVERARAAVLAGTLDRLRADVAAVWA